MIRKAFSLERIALEKQVYRTLKAYNILSKPQANTILMKTANVYNKSCSYYADSLLR